LRGNKGGIKLQVTVEMMKCEVLIRDVMEHLWGSHDKPLESPLAMRKCKFHVHDGKEQCDLDYDIL